MNNKLIVHGTEISVTTIDDKDYISLTDMLRAKDGDFFISDWLRNRNTVEFLGIWEQIHNPDFNYGEFAAIRSQAGLNSYKLSVKEWVEKTHAIGLRAKAAASILLRCSKNPECKCVRDFSFLRFTKTDGSILEESEVRENGGSAVYGKAP